MSFSINVCGGCCPVGTIGEIVGTKSSLSGWNHNLVGLKWWTSWLGLSSSGRNQCQAGINVLLKSLSGWWYHCRAEIIVEMTLIWHHRRDEIIVGMSFMTSSSGWDDHVLSQTEVNHRWAGIIVGLESLSDKDWDIYPRRAGKLRSQIISSGWKIATGWPGIAGFFVGGWGVGVRVMKYYNLCSGNGLK